VIFSSYIGIALTATFEWRLTARELELRLQVIAGHLGESVPERQMPNCFLHWLLVT
jgi:hypothetical protein